MGLKEDNPTVEDLILQLQSSFFSAEFQQVAKTLTEREEHIKDEYLKLKKKAEEEKDAIFKENMKLRDQLKKKEEEIGAMKKLIDEYKRKTRVYENRFDDKGLGLEKKAKESMGSSLNLAESCRPPGFTKKEGSKRKLEAKSHEIINIDDDDDQGKRVTDEVKREYIYNIDDDDLVVFPSTKRRRAASEIKTTPGSKETKKITKKIELDSPEEPDSGSDTEKINKAYMSSISKVKKHKEEWKLESDMVKDLEKDDELCLNGVCALQKIIVHGADTDRLTTLGRKLIDGDSQNKLKKKASELNQYDLKDCRMFAKKYSLQLFNIYQDKSDPFFPTSRSQEKRSDV
ncbi:hypothetical protein HanPI659440_Chr17g0663041 [Helianthus annuus]|nr:hypothetical protein HanPI659440_Chr17g0663041 [Helianthus annuus]